MKCSSCGKESKAGSNIGIYCSALQHGIPGALLACGLQTGHEGPHMFTRTLRPEEIPAGPSIRSLESIEAETEIASLRYELHKLDVRAMILDDHLTMLTDKRVEHALAEARADADALAAALGNLLGAWEVHFPDGVPDGCEILAARLPEADKALASRPESARERVWAVEALIEARLNQIADGDIGSLLDAVDALREAWRM